MIPRARDLRKLWFEWPESCYGRFNFHRDEQVDALVEALLSDSAPAVAVLAGEPGPGRGFVCDAARFRAREAGHEVAVSSRIHRGQGELEEAHKLGEEVLQARRRILGSKHPHTLTSMAGLAKTYKAQGNPTRARVMAEEVLEGRRRTLGPKHPDTLESEGDLASIDD